MRIIAHSDRCIAAGHCVVAAADLFTQDEEDGIVSLLTDQVPDGRAAAAQDAARRCPTHAIELVAEPSDGLAAAKQA